ncbi:MAG: TorF family putative porin [Betaproteobacteria bacterium]
MKAFFLPSLLAGASLLAAAGVMAQTAPAPAAPAAPESSLAFNAGLVSDYRYRGISQSRLQPAVQGGADYTDKSGFYVGAWATTINWIKDSGATSGSVELDLYGGYKASIGDIGYDVGVLRYEYVGNKLAKVDGFANANTTEAYGALTYGLFTAKYSYALGDTFGNVKSKGSTYIDLSAAIDLGSGFALTPHVGRQVIKNGAIYSYTDYSLTLAKDLGNGLSATGMLVTTNAKESSYTLKGKFNGKDALVVGIKYTF